MSSSRFQFTLKHGLLGITLLSVLFAFIAWAGLFGAVLFGGACGVALIGCAVVKRDGRCLVSGILLASGAGTLIVAGSRVAVGDGFSTLPCRVQIVDPTGKAIPAANVRLRNARRHFHPEGFPVHPIPADERPPTGVTDADGCVTLNFEFPNSSKSGLFINESRVHISSDLWIQVDAAGYEREMVRMNDVLKRSYDWDALPLPKVVIQLKRTFINGGRMNPGERGASAP